MTTDPSHTVWDDEEAEREAALAAGDLADADEDASPEGAPSEGTGEQ
ncbi:MAG: hypothetical protein L0G89_04375 [Janibacter sp.]|nr:hypothetical protein [Janibacter sp.]